ncbi:hypothetical protein SAMN05443144_109187 [Fodinibius roseus]|uniref:Exopolysaccharide Exporter (EPS-E) n=1 Tax=Fodinibius roseus TaxID=1194090 RepID=A0A1M5CD03_9BACT|nr:hypothetical protein [Fodinibius roseus]SHF52560.1 hypothetical protein SAMN05443144_109187 [Fodinibius roseus]
MEQAVDIQQATINSRDELKARVKDLLDNPLSVWAVAATIESLGIREVDAQREFGYESILDLADQIYKDLKEEIHQKAPEISVSNKEIYKTGFWVQIKNFVVYYSQGLLFSLPLISQIAALFIFRYSLWAWLDFNEAQATIVAFGTMAAFIVTGGFVQILGHSISSYVSSGNYYLALKSSKKIAKSGMVGVLAFCFLVVLLNVIIPFYPPYMVFLGLTYMILISLLLLASGVLYALKQRIAILAVIVAGTLLVIVNMEVFHWGIYISQWTAMLVTTLFLAGYALFYFKWQIRKKQQRVAMQALPVPEVHHFISYRYFIYGLSYFLFIFMDRLLAWSTGELPPPFILWFNTPYEIGMDWALITLILSFAMLEYSVNVFSRELKPLQKKISFLQLEHFNKYFKKLYFKQVLLLTLTGLLSIVITYYSVRSLIIFQDTVPEVRDFFTNYMTTKVFWIASISYLFLNIGLLHCLFFFSLNKPVFAMYSILAGLAVNFSVGFFCSRVFALEYATVGLLAGSIVFAVISGSTAMSLFKRLDYYYYSAF